MLNSLRNRLNARAGWVLLAGLAGIVALNWRQWRRDQVLLEEGDQLPPLPLKNTWPSLPTVTVLVAAWNEANNIQSLFESFSNLTYPNKELILCAGGLDETFDLARKVALPEISVLEQYAGEGKQKALERSLAFANGEIIYLTDADCRLHSEDFERLVCPIVKGDETVTTGTSRPHRENLANSYVYHQWVTGRYAQLKSLDRYSGGLLGRNCAVLREAIEQAWSVEANVPTGTDYYLALRLRELGHRIRYLPDSQVETGYPQSTGAYIRQQARWTRNLLLLGLRYQDWYHVRSALVSAVVGTAMLALPMMVFFIGPIGLVLWLLAWTAVLLNRIRYASVVARVEGPISPTLSVDLVRVMLSDFVAWARIFWDIWRRENREQW